jgi:hypothetical protein
MAVGVAQLQVALCVLALHLLLGLLRMAWCLCRWALFAGADQVGRLVNRVRGS